MTGSERPRDPAGFAPARTRGYVLPLGTRAARRRPEGEAMGPRDAFITYDELRGPELDAARWSAARLPRPGGGAHVPLEPGAEVAVGEGEVRVTIPRFSLADDDFQPADSAKHLVFSTHEWEVPPDRPAAFAVDFAVTNIGGEPADYRRGMAAFHVFDLAVTKRVFAVCGTSTRVLALHEQLGLGGGGRASRSTMSPSRRTRTSTTTSPGSASARSRSTGRDRRRPGASTATRSTRPAAP